MISKLHMRGGRFGADKGGWKVSLALANPSWQPTCCQDCIWGVSFAFRQPYESANSGLCGATRKSSLDLTALRYVR